MTGIVEQCLTDRLGQPAEDGEEGGLVARRWLQRGDPRTSVLYYAPAPSSPSVPSLEPIYGAARAGVIAGTALKLAALGAEVPFGVPALEGYRETPELRDVLAEQPGITFFMDAGNVYFYGLAGDEVVEFDAGTGELDPLGPPEAAVGEIVDQWLAAAEG
jgi:hypothetical protein